jgi:hypothetical protein
MKCTYTSWCSSVFYLSLRPGVLESLICNAELQEIYLGTLHAVIMVLHVLLFQEVTYV